MESLTSLCQNRSDAFDLRPRLFLRMLSSLTDRKAAATLLDSCAKKGLVIPSCFFLRNNTTRTKEKTFGQKFAMARAYQTARKSTGGKAPRQQLATRRVQTKKPAAKSPRSMGDDISKFLLNNHLSDVSFIVGAERRRFPGHRTILAARSPRFEGLFSGTFADSSSKGIEALDHEPGPFGVMLEFIYTDKVGPRPSD
jgi:hypothetical protein